MYGSNMAALWFFAVAVALWAFVAFVPLADAPWQVRFVVVPAFALYLWATPPPGQRP